MKKTLPKISTKIFVETPEQIDFAYETAGLGPRILAYLLDLLIRVALIVVISIVVVIITGGAMFGLGLIAVLSFLLEWGYFTFLEWLWDGVTPGKKALNLRVVRTNGVSIDLYRSTMRNLLRAADGFPPLFAFLELFPFPSYAVAIGIIFIVGKGRRLGDLAADTMVIIDERAKLDKLPPLPDSIVDISTQAIVAAGIDSKEMAMIDDFFRRRKFFSKERCEELAEILAVPLAKKIGIKTDDHEGLLAGILQGGYEQRTTLTGGN